MITTWKNLRHWTIHISRWEIERWCAGAPCHLTANRRHPIRVYQR